MDYSVELLEIDPGGHKKTETVHAKAGYENRETQVVKGVRILARMVGYKGGQELILVSKTYAAGTETTFAQVDVPVGGTVEYEFDFVPIAEAYAQVQTGRFLDGYYSGWVVDVNVEYSFNGTAKAGSYTHAYSFDQLRDDFDFTMIVNPADPKIEGFEVFRANPTTKDEEDDSEDVCFKAVLSATQYAPTGGMPGALYTRRAGVESWTKLVDFMNVQPGGSHTYDVILTGVDFYQNYGYEFKVELGDHWEMTVLTQSVPKAFANVHLSAYPEGGVCFGGFSKATELEKPMFESRYPAYLYEGIEDGGVNINATDSADGPEIASGYWYGRQVYRKTFMPKTFSARSSRGTDTIASVPDDFVKLVRYECMLSLSNGVQRMIPFYYGDTTFAEIRVTSGEIQLIHSEGSTSNIPTVYATVWYTKEA